MSLIFCPKLRTSEPQQNFTGSYKKNVIEQTLFLNKKNKQEVKGVGDIQKNVQADTQTDRRTEIL